MLPIRDSLQIKNSHRLKVRGWKTVRHANENLDTNTYIRKHRL